MRDTNPSQALGTGSFPAVSHLKPVLPWSGWETGILLTTQAMENKQTEKDKASQAWVSGDFS